MTEETIFAAALDKQTPAERSAFLDEACGGDAALRQRVAALLTAHEQAADFLDKPAVEQMAAREAITSTPAAAVLGATQAEPSSVAEDRISLDFLTPSDRADALGRLGHYQVLAVIGRGGMGVVLKAFDQELQRVVAIKVMTVQMAVMGTARKRFRREAQAAAAVRDEHIIDIHAVEEVNGLPYLVMEFVSGISLQDGIDRNGPLELKEILRIGMQTAKGLAKAHAQGLIHRDIKPANILLENGVQRVKITDFGLARAVDDSSLTQSGVIAGTPQYMAPEQARGEAVDHRADLFSLGSVLYAMCTGHPPFRASSTMAVLKRVCDDTPRPIREINLDIPNWLVVIIAKLHVKDPAQRFQSAQEVADLLEQHLLHLQQPSAVPLPPSLAPPAISRPGKRSSSWRWVLATVCLLFLSLSCCGLGVPALVMFLSIGALVTSEQIVPRTTSAIKVDAAAPAVPFRVPFSLPGHDSVVWCVAWAPDGQMLASASGDNTVKLWKRVDASWRCETTLRGHLPIQRPGRLFGVRCVAFAPDGKTLATGSFDGTIQLWDVALGKEQATLVGHKDMINALAFSPDGKTLASAGLDEGVKLWDLKRRKEQATLRVPSNWVWSIAFSADGKTLASADQRSDQQPGPGVIKLWDLATRTERATLEGHVDWVNSVAFAPKGHLLASGNHDCTVKLWDTTTQQVRTTFTGHQGSVYGVAFSPDGNWLASASMDRTVRLWEVATGQQKQVFQGHFKMARCVAFSPDGRTLASTDDSANVKLWDVSPFLSAADARAAEGKP